MSAPAIHVDINRLNGASGYENQRGYGLLPRKSDPIPLCYCFHNANHRNDSDRAEPPVNCR